MMIFITTRFTRFVIDSLRLDVSPYYGQIAKYYCVILASEYKAITTVCQALGERNNTTDFQCYMYLEALPNCRYLCRPPHQRPQLWAIQHIIMVIWPGMANRPREIASVRPLVCLSTISCSHSRWVCASAVNHSSQQWPPSSDDTRQL